MPHSILNDLPSPSIDKWFVAQELDWKPVEGMDSNYAMADISWLDQGQRSTLTNFCRPWRGSILTPETNPELSAPHIRIDLQSTPDEVKEIIRKKAAPEKAAELAQWRMGFVEKALKLPWQRFGDSDLFYVDLDKVSDVRDAQRALSIAAHSARAVQIDGIPSNNLGIYLLDPSNHPVLSETLCKTKAPNFQERRHYSTLEGITGLPWKRISSGSSQVYLDMTPYSDELQTQIRKSLRHFSGSASESRITPSMEPSDNYICYDVRRLLKNDLGRELLEQAAASQRER